MLQVSTVVMSQTSAIGKDEEHRPKVHFSPKAHWMNDPNGMGYYNGVYHLFFQYYPDKPVWEPVHWYMSYKQGYDPLERRADCPLPG